MLIATSLSLYEFGFSIVVLSLQSLNKMFSMKKKRWEYLWLIFSFSQVCILCWLLRKTHPGGHYMPHPCPTWVARMGACKRKSSSHSFYEGRRLTKQLTCEMPFPGSPHHFCECGSARIRHARTARLLDTAHQYTVCARADAVSAGTCDEHCSAVAYLFESVVGNTRAGRLWVGGEHACSLSLRLLCRAVRGQSPRPDPQLNHFFSSARAGTKPSTLGSSSSTYGDACMAAVRRPCRKGRPGYTRAS